ncbi:MAG: hypothetical protein HY323_14375 [Betaproteobacteria bacterium]|nr:hypothetical protein [Betaproteobacteria bacterium]
MSDPMVTVRLTVYELDGTDHYKPGGLIVESHWNDHDRVVLVVDGKRYTVVASDLADAAERARKPR